MRFFCTAGRGTEIFAYQEVRKEFDIWNDLVPVSEGRVYFQGDVNQIENILQLKTVERAFALVLHVDSKKYKDLDRATFLNNLRTDILNEDSWKTEDLITVIEHLKSRHVGKLQREVIPVGGEGPPSKKIKQERNPSFRVSCKCSGVLGRKVSAQLLAKQIGIKLSQLMRWNVNFKDPDIEVCIQVNDIHVSVGIPLTRVPLSKREYVKCHGLRGPVTWIMSNFLGIKNHGVILDPMCGKATILLEAAKHIEGVFCIGCDISKDQLKLAQENINFGKVQDRLQLIKGDCRALPLTAESVDGIVCDTPFGKKYNVKESSIAFHASLLQEMHRVLKKNGMIVLLVSEEMHHIIKNAGYWYQPCVQPGQNKGEDDRHPQTKDTEDYCFVVGDQSKTSLHADTVNLNIADSSDQVVDDPKKSFDQNLKHLQHYKSSSLLPHDLDSQAVEKIGQCDSLVLKDSGMTDKGDELASSVNRNGEVVKCDVMEGDMTGRLSSVLQKFHHVCDHYIKLGETDSFIFVLRKKVLRI
ncbi:THUMP domain-containing protein 2-like [Saccostrea echinata]|uniref:THUMP domain-containing protein 2-like n=1 Tax=Saccostrea echinata TaxID=191078 RepID=UPI002A8346DC|nr:THUMP domain-containing protein 2-like [Saccostrea echinata]